MKTSIQILFVVFPFLSISVFAGGFRSELSVTSIETPVYVEIELNIPLIYKGEHYKSLHIGIYNEKKKALFTGELKAYLTEEEAQHMFRLNPEVVEHTNISIVYGEGVLCDNNLFNFRLSDLLSKNVEP